jgi:hypothetical protein
MADAPAADDPGRPRARDELDPDLIKLRRSGPRFGPLLCIAIIGFCLYLMFALWPDLRFRRGGDEPTKVASAASLVSADGPGVDAFVAANLQPDRSFALRLPASTGAKTRRLVPIHGTGNRLWLMVGGEPWVEQPTYHDVYAGRLKRLDDLPFADSLRSRARDAVVPRWVEPKALREALEKGAGSVRDPFGDEVGADAATPVTVVERVREGARVVANLREFLPDEGAWLADFAKAGVAVVGNKAIETTEKDLVFEVHDPEGVTGVTKKLRAIQNYSFAAEPLIRRYESTWGALKPEPAGLRAGETTVAWDNFDAAALASARPVPGDAMVLVANEKPATYWYVWPVFIGLGLFAALFIWALVRAIRHDRAQVAEPATSTP